MPVDPNEPPEETSALEEWRRVATLSAGLAGGGVMIAGSTWVGYLLGRWLDGKAGLSHDVFATILPLLGFAGGLWQMWRMVKHIQSRQDRSGS